MFTRLFRRNWNSDRMKKILALLLVVVITPVLAAILLLINVKELFSPREYTKEDWKRGAIEW